MHSERSFDVICIGRIAVDFYSQQIGSRLEDTTSFSKYLGGSSGNVAYGTAVQGLRSSMLARVGDEHNGRFIQEELERIGCDTSFLIKDKERLTALVILGIKDKNSFPLIFYRDNCADMALSRHDFTEDYIASARCLAITGTHLSHPSTRDAVLTALKYAQSNGVKTVLDIDYRPVLWGLTGLGDGETRFIQSDKVTKQLQEVLGMFDVIVGTEEEFHISGGSTHTIEALKRVRKVSGATFVCKRSALGCSVYPGAIPETLDEGLTIDGVRVDVFNVLGAGDAFMSGLLRGYLNNEGWKKACQYANACGALVVSRHGCAPAMPTKIELDNYLSRVGSVPRPDLDKELNHLHRVTTRKAPLWDNLCIMAYDHRAQFIELCEATGANLERIKYLKKLILQAHYEVEKEAGLQGRCGLLCDSTFGQEVLNSVTGKGWWIGRPIEMPLSRPLRLEHGNIGSQLVDWPSEHIVKCLCLYSPDDDDVIRLQQEELLTEIYQSTCKSGHELLLEIILPPSVSSGEGDLYIDALRRLYTLDIKPDWWKIPPQEKLVWPKISDVITQNDPYCRGVVLLGLDASHEELQLGFNNAAGQSIVKGFAVGRTLFGAPSRGWLEGDLDDRQTIEHIKARYHQLIFLWQNRG